MKGAIILATVVAAVALGACRKEVPPHAHEARRGRAGCFADALRDFFIRRRSAAGRIETKTELSAHRGDNSVFIFFGGLSRGVWLRRLPRRGSKQRRH